MSKYILRGVSLGARFGLSEQWHQAVLSALCSSQLPGSPETLGAVKEVLVWIQPSPARHRACCSQAHGFIT